MADARINSSELARATGLPATTIKRIRNNTQCNPTLSTLEPIANYFSITLNELLGKHKIQPQHGSTLPLLKWSDDFQLAIHQNDTHTINTELSLPAGSFALPIESDELHPFSKGGVILIDCTRTPKTFDYVIIKQQGGTEAILKKLIIESNEKYLKSLVPGIQLTPLSELTQILGVVTQYKLNSSPL